MSSAFTQPGSAAALPARAAAVETSSDDMLVARIGEGDRLAMQTLFARHRTPVYRWLLRFVGNETLAEDLVSDVFLDVWRQASRFEGRASVSTWLIAIARFKAISARRCRTDAELDEGVALTRLSAEHKEIIDLVYYHEKSVDECAQIIGVPSGTVKTRMFYARKKLAELVKAA